MKETLLILIPWGSSWWEGIVAREVYTARGQPVLRFRVLGCLQSWPYSWQRQNDQWISNELNLWTKTGHSLDSLLTLLAMQTEFEGTSERREESQRWYHGSCPRFRRKELWSCSRSWIMKSRSGKWNDCTGNGKHTFVHEAELAKVQAELKSARDAQVGSWVNGQWEETLVPSMGWDFCLDSSATVLYLASKGCKLLWSKVWSELRLCQRGGVLTWLNQSILWGLRGRKGSIPGASGVVIYE